MFIIVVWVQQKVNTIKIIIIYIISYDIYSILMCQYHLYLMTLLTNFKLYINIHNKYHLMIISFMECLISHKNEYYQNAGLTCKICKLKRYYIILKYLSFLFSHITLLLYIYIYIYRFITVYILRQPLVVLLVSFTVSATSCIEPCSVKGIPTTILNLSTCILALCLFYSV